MKHETSILLEKFHSDKRLKFVDSEVGLELEHDLSDQEKTELVQTEYGQTVVGDLDILFVKIMKELISIAVEKAKQMYKNQLSEL